jgi:Secretion system C-terminal sorting domain
MKKFFVLFFGLLFIMMVKSFAQITITANDEKSYLAVGSKKSINEDTSAAILNIGKKGLTSWDFSSLTSDTVINTNIVSPSSTPFGNKYPSATEAEVTNIGNQAQSWSYISINNAFLNYGSASQEDSISFISKNIPAVKGFVLPLTMGFGWTNDYVTIDSNIFTSSPPIVYVDSVHEEDTVDAYGNMKLPGGTTVPALRIKKDIRFYIKADNYYSRLIVYNFLSTNGSGVTVSADTTSPDTGVVKVEGITYTISGLTDIKQANNPIPENFNLEQNYPNPFNPSTTIEYVVPQSSFVSIKVYDDLGREVTTLVNGEKSSGNYTVDFNASNLASGIYFYRMQAGSFVSTKKLILLK